VWLLKNLRHNLKNNLLAASANAIKMALQQPKQQISYETLHIIANRAMQICFVNTNWLLCYTEHSTMKSHVKNGLNLISTKYSHPDKHTSESIHLNNLHVVGKNALTNRFHDLNGIIDLKLLKLNLISYKMVGKNLFLIMFK
jgi:predicted deacetylase